MIPAPIGHDRPRALLRRLAAQTLLFVGPERVGRRQVARWYAAWLNCAAPSDEPCGRCASCEAMRLGAHPDYREVAPEVTTKGGRASRRLQLRIGDLVPREGPGENPDPLGPWLLHRPVYKRRVGVIDQAETLTEQAANAFLKMLEEPPSYVTLILIAVNEQAVLPTVASRSTPVRLAPVYLPEGQPLPAARLGRIGDVIGARADPQAFGELVALLDDYLAALPRGLDEALLRADALEKRWSTEGETDLAELLRARVSRWPPGAYAEAIAALERCEAALAAYAAPGLAVQVLTLALRDIVRRYSP